jgi:CBS domain-containing protein
MCRETDFFYRLPIPRCNMAKSSGLVLKKLLESYTVDSLPTPKGRAIVIDSQSSLLQGFETLVDNNILSAPVYDASKNKYIGFLDVRDLVSFVVFLVDEQKVSDTKTLKDIITHGIKMFKTPTTDGVTISYLSRRNKFIPVQEEATLWTAAQIIARQSVHRVPVVNKEGKVVNIISQSSLLGFLNDHLTELKEETDKTIGELRIGSRPVTSVNKDAAVIEAFRLMDRHRRSGVALVDNSGRLVGTTTGKDLGVRFNSTVPLKASINKFMRQLLSNSSSARLFVHSYILCLRSFSLKIRHWRRWNRLLYSTFSTQFARSRLILSLPPSLFLRKIHLEKLLAYWQPQKYIVCSFVTMSNFLDRLQSFP